MVKSRKKPSPEQVNGLRRQIQEWRENRQRTGSMPGELWD
jgi:hypothetical protein